MTVTQPATAPISRDTLEAKFRELQGGVDETRESATSTLITIGAVVAVGVIAIAFLAGRRRGKKRSTVVEVRRI
ncbi:MAG: hypothetical protein WD691_01865 [Acidimicrobiales bacterium]